MFSAGFAKQKVTGMEWNALVTRKEGRMGGKEGGDRKKGKKEKCGKGGKGEGRENQTDIENIDKDRFQEINRSEICARVTPLGNIRSLYIVTT